MSAIATTGRRDGRAHLVIYATAEAIHDDPLRAELTAGVYSALGGWERPDERQRTVPRVTPESVVFHS